MIHNLIGGASGGGMPVFTYSGTYTLVDDGEGNWRIKFLTSGKLIFSKNPGKIDVFLCGGGCGANYKSGGGGGYTKTIKEIAVSKNTEYEITIGAGGSWRGGTSSAFNNTAEGGYFYARNNDTDTYSDPYNVGGNGGSGGAGHEGVGGSDGSNGTGNNGGIPGLGQGSTTREFGESTGTLYAGGGGSYYGTGGSTGSRGAGSGAENTGGGDCSVKGYSGIVVIRNHRG